MVFVALSFNSTANFIGHFNFKRIKSIVFVSKRTIPPSCHIACLVRDISLDMVKKN